jgi:glycosyltransferase involved in cell wall biosynthesis
MTIHHAQLGAKSAMVSVIMPTYNRAHLLHESILSVLSQTYENLEIIVVDDGSSDDTKEVVTSFSDPRINYIWQPNRGRSNARNHGLSLARGNFIAFLDSDDLYLPDKIKSQVDYLEKHPEAGMVYTSAYCINEKGEKLAHRYEATVSGEIYESIAFFTTVTITLPTVMTYKTVFERVGGFDEKMDRFEDTDMWRRISKEYRIDAMPEFTCLLRTHSDNVLPNQDPDMISSALEYYATKIMKEDQQIDMQVRSQGVAGLYLYYGMALMRVPRFFKTGIDLMRISNSYDPLIKRLFGFVKRRVSLRVKHLVEMVASSRNQ